MKNKIIFIILSVAIIFTISLLEQGFSDADKPHMVVESVATSSDPFSVSVLVYHSVRPWYDGMSDEVKLYTVRPESLRAHLDYIKQAGYTVVSLQDVADAVENRKSIPAKSVVITFDDGWENQYTYAFPILKEYGVTATFFVFTNAPKSGYSKWLSWDQVRELDRAGMSIGSHSVSHPYLHKITDEEDLINEIRGSKEIIEKELGHPIFAFAYPFGMYTEHTIDLVRDAGYRVGRIFVGGDYNSDEDIFTMSGILVNDDIEKLKRQLP